MTELLSDTTTPSDAELISSVRGGDLAAYGELFARHKDAATRLARQLVRGPDADDLVSDAFAKVLNVLQGGGGPDVAFRAYLLTAVRRLHVDKMRATAKVRPSDDMSEFDGATPFQDTAVAAFESGAAARAFATLPERWQLVLWHLEVEGQKPADIAPLLGMSPNSVSALAYRAREGLRQAFLTMHLNDTSETHCRWVNEHLGAYVRKGLSNRDATKVQTHLDQCRRCTAMYLELTEVNSNLAGIIAPLLLGGAAAGYLSSTGAAGGLGLTALFGRVRDVVGANAGAATAAGVAAGVAAVVTAGALMLPNGPERLVTVNDPGAVTSAPATPPPAAPGPAEDDAPDAESGPAEEAAADDQDADAAETAGTVANAEPAAATFPGPPAEAPSEPSGNEASAPAQPDDGPGAGEPVTSDLSFSAPVSFDGDAVTFTIAGDPLPPTVGLGLVSEPRGIEFRENGSACTLASGTRAECSTGALARGGSAMLRGMASAPRAFSGSIRLRVPVDQPDTLVRLVVSVPRGYTDPSDEESNSSSFRYRANRSAPPAGTGVPAQPVAQPPGGQQQQPPVGNPGVEDPGNGGDVEVAMGLEAFGTTAEPDSMTGVYKVNGRLVGLHPGMDELTVELAGPARVSTTGESPCSVVSESPGGTTLLCRSNGASSLDLAMELAPPAGRVTLSVLVPDGYKDDEAAGTPPNTVDISLLAPPVLLAYTADPTATATIHTNDYDLSATLSGLPADAGTIVFRAKRDSGTPAVFDSVTTPPGACTVDDDQVTCTVPADTGTFVLAALVKLPGNQNFELEASVGDQTVGRGLRYLP